MYRSVLLGRFSFLITFQWVDNNSTVLVLFCVRFPIRLNGWNIRKVKYVAGMLQSGSFSSVLDTNRGTDWNVPRPDQQLVRSTSSNRLVVTQARSKSLHWFLFLACIIFQQIIIFFWTSPALSHSFRFLLFFTIHDALFNLFLLYINLFSVFVT
jgi:hypothetical protein